jgi:hypothetical protein
MHLHCISLTFDDFKSLLQNFGLAQTGSKFGNFGLGNGKNWKSPYRRYLQSECGTRQHLSSLAEFHSVIQSLSDAK